MTGRLSRVSQFRRYRHRAARGRDLGAQSRGRGIARILGEDTAQPGVGQIGVAVLEILFGQRKGLCVATVGLDSLERLAGATLCALDGQHALVAGRRGVEISRGARFVAHRHQFLDGFGVAARDVQLVGQVVGIGDGGLLQLLQAYLVAAVVEVFNALLVQLGGGARDQQYGADQCHTNPAKCSVHCESPRGKLC